MKIQGNQQTPDTNEESYDPACDLDAQDEGNAIFVSDEFGSSSASNDGCEDLKLNGDTIRAPHNLGSVVSVAEIGVDSNEAHNEPKREDTPGHAAHGKVLKKPDKPLPCPRCDSLDTKFCYFNNYNVNQPRHFCKNCQRYWTAGGTLRNVPVGAGRRKNKHSASHQKSVMPSFGAVRNDSGDLAHQRIPCSGVTTAQFNFRASQTKPRLLPQEVGSITGLDSPSSATLTFGPASPLCESMTAASLTVHKTTPFQNRGSSAEVQNNGNCKASRDAVPQARSGFISPNNRNHETTASIGWLPTDESVSGSSLTTQAVRREAPEVETGSDPALRELKANDEGHSVWENGAGFSNFVGPWQYGFNMAWSNPMAPASTSVLQNDNGANPAPAFAPPNSLTWNMPPGGLWTGVPWPLMHTTMWGPPPEWAGSWSMPWGPAAAAAAVAAAAAAAAAVTAATPNPELSSALQKHPTESSHTDSKNNGCLWVPKTLRIDDPVEAARSSIWTTLGLGDRPGPLTVGGAVKAFHPKTEAKETEEQTMQTRHTNPAAMTRSMAFHENS